MKIPDIQIKTTLTILLFIFYTILIAQPINLYTADLGRYIVNGRIFFENLTIPSTNLYSYTFPEYPFINHHWATGVIFYPIYLLLGFKGLSLFFLALSLATFYLFFDLARKYSNFEIAFLVALTMLPVISTRTEIRPEAISYFFSAIYFWILLNVYNNKLNKKYLFLLPFIQFFWVNIHIYFFFGLLLIFGFLSSQIFNSLIFKKGKINMHLPLFLSITASLINPYFFQGLIHPLNIYKNYGYRILEEQNVLFIQNLMHYPPAINFEIGFFVFAASWIIALYFIFKKHQKLEMLYIGLSIGISVFGWLMIRNFTLFGLFATTLISINLYSLAKTNYWKNLSRESVYLYTFSISFSLLLFFLYANPDYFKNRNYFQIGVSGYQFDSVRFFKENNLKGPIFNNYDIGGFLIYNFYPEEKVFVDNRPEVYPASFFKEVYIPMQEDEKIWQEVDKKYSFNTIFFYRHDLTNWGQKFLVSKIKDPNWTPVYVDDFAIIFLKNNDKNKELIKKFALPKNIFTTK